MSSDLDFCSVDKSVDASFVAWFYEQLADEQFILAFQPVMSTAQFGKVLYYEGLLRNINGRMKINPFSVLESENSIRLLDECVVDSVISHLSRHRNLTLGCNISAQSAVLDSAWLRVISTLREQPLVAHRLVIEITESASVCNYNAAVSFVEEMKTLGCLIAIDDFGSGFSTLQFVRDAKPDIIKIDMGYLERARASGVEFHTLKYLLRIAETLVRYVVIEGVEFESDNALISELAVEWAQGFLIGKPLAQPLPSFERCVIFGPIRTKTV